MRKILFTFRFLPLFLASVILFLTNGCISDNDRIKTVIKGEFPAFAGKMVTLSEIDIYKANPIDTTRIKADGSFRFSFKRDQAGFYLVKVDNRNYVTLILDNENRIRISTDGKDLRSAYQVEGSPDSELYRQFELFHEKNRARIDSLSRIFNDYQRSPSFLSVKLELDENYKQVYDSQRAYTISFLENNCQSLASLLVINRRFGQRLVMNEHDDYEYFALLDSCLSMRYPGNKHLAEHQLKIQKAREKMMIHQMLEEKLAPGNKAPDISLNTPGGQSISLYSQAGLPVIVYLWASWDQNSRKFNKELLKLTNRIGSNNIRVYAIGFESYKETWVNTIELDGIQNWIHVTDYLNIHSSAKSLFNVPDDLPLLYLLDKNMIIRYKGNDLTELIDKFNQLNN